MCPEGRQAYANTRGEQRTERNHNGKHAVSERRVVNKAEKVLVFVCFPSGRVTDVRLGKQMISGIDLRLWLRDLT